MKDWKTFFAVNKKKVWYTLVIFLSFLLLVLFMRLVPLFTVYQRVNIEEFIWNVYFWPTEIIKWIFPRNAFFMDFAETIGIIPNALYFYVIACLLYARKRNKE